MPLTRKNHYVPQLYLKHFASTDGRLFHYRTLVSRDSVREWKPINIAGADYQSHLYTRTLAQGDSDEIELWLNKEFETPAAQSINKAINDERLSKEDYRLLTRFLAAQIVRTPAFLVNSLPRWRSLTEQMLENVSEEIKKATENNDGDTGPLPNAEYLPLRVSRETSEDGKSVRFVTQTVVGRGTWIFAMRHLLTDTLNKLTEHHWTILSSENDLPWFTTDDPVVRLNFRSPSHYDFEGGWGIPKTNIFLPLSPKHLLFTEVGDKSPYQRGEILPRPTAIMLRKMIAEHAFRYIFSPSPDPAITAYRPRMVSAQAVEHERNEWHKWHREQSAAERDLLKDPTPNSKPPFAGNPAPAV